MKKNYVILVILIAISNLLSSQSTIVNQDWLRTYSQRDSSKSSPTAIDLNGNVYVAGFVISSGSNMDYLLLKYDTMGTLQWARTYDGTAGNDDRITAIVTDTSGYIYITGKSQGINSNFDYVTIKYDTAGSQLWTVRYNGTGNGADIPTAIATDYYGNVFVTGVSAGNGSANDYLTIRYSSNGTQQWVSRYNGNANADDKATAMTISNVSRIIVTGQSQNGNGTNDIHTICYNASTGNPMWQDRYNGNYNGNDVSTSIITNSFYAYAGGSTQVASNNCDYILIKYDVLNGNRQFVSTYDGYGNNDEIKSLAFDTLGNIYGTGITYNNNLIEYLTVKYNTSGTLKWANKYPLNINNINVTNQILVDHWNMVYICGETKGTNNRDFVFYRLNSNGDFQWDEKYNGTANMDDGASDMVVDIFGRIYVTGQTQNSSSYFDITTIRYSQSFAYAPLDFYGDTALSSALFYENKGQLINDTGAYIPQERFYTTNFYPSLYFTNTNMSYVFSKIDTVASTVDTVQRVDMDFLGCNQLTTMHPLEQDSGWLNYYLPQCPNGVINVRGYKRLFVPNIYNNIDLHYYSNENGLKFYFVVKPFSKPSSIMLQFTGADSVIITPDSCLKIKTKIGEFKYKAPIAYQADTLAGIIPYIVPLNWKADWQYENSNTVRFNIGTYDHTLPLVIQVGKGQLQPLPTPVMDNLMWSTYFGGDNIDEIMSSALDTLGNLFVCGDTYSNNTIFPYTTNINYQQINGYSDAFFGNFKSSRQRIWVTYYGGSSGDYASAVAADHSSNVYFGGGTLSPDFPLQYLQGAYNNNDVSFNFLNCFIVKLNKFWGTKVWATYFGDSLYTDDRIYDMEVNNGNNLYVCGNTTRQSDFPIVTPAGAYKKDTMGIYLGYISRFDANDSLIWSTLFGSGNTTVYGLAIDDSSNVFITGLTSDYLNDLPVVPFNNAYTQNFTGFCDAFVTKFNSSNVIKWSTFYGSNYFTQAMDIAVCKQTQDVYVVGNTLNTINYPNYTFPCKFTNTSYKDSLINGSDGFIIRFDNNGVRKWASLFGGTGSDLARRVVVDTSSNIYVVGETSSNNIDTISKLWYYQQYLTYNQFYNNTIAFVCSFNKFDTLTWATYFGAKTCSTCVTHAFSANLYDNSTLYITGYSNMTSVYPYDFPFIKPNNLAYFDNVYKSDLYDGFISEFNVAPPVVTNVEKLNNNKDNNLVVYPSPSHEKVNINFSSKDKNKIVLKVIDVYGRLLETKIIDKQNEELNYELNLSSYPKGVYIITLISNTGTYSKKVIIY